MCECVCWYKKYLGERERERKRAFIIIYTWKYISIKNSKSAQKTQFLVLWNEQQECINYPLDELLSA